MAERTKATVLKTVSGATRSWVRIPLLPRARFNDARRALAESRGLCHLRSTSLFALRLIMSVAALVATAGCTEQTDGTRPEPGAGCENEACRLAVLDANGEAPTETMVRKYQLALDALDDDCPETEEQLGRYAADVQAHLAESGLEDSLFNILSDLNLELGGGIEGPQELDSCEDAFMGYAIVRS
jgi:hypothetical protein